MNNRTVSYFVPKSVKTLMLAISLISPAVLFAQATATMEPAKAPGDEKVVMSPFEVKGDQVSRYQASEASSGGRVAIDLFDAPQSISVVTNDFMQDTGAKSLLEATQILAGISNNSQPFIDRLTIRGFQVNNAGDVDGFYLPPTALKMDPVMFERVELVRGPNAIISPAASPGGTMNIVTKVAQFKDFGSATLELGEYDTNRGNFDINRFDVKQNFAYRLVVGYEDFTQGKNQGYHNEKTIDASVVWQISKNARLEFQYLFRWGRQFNGLGFPIDPSVGPNTPVKMLSGMNQYQSGYADNINDPSARLEDNTNTLRALFTSNITDRLSMRVAARSYTGWESYNQWNLLGNAGGAVNPLTGFYTPGFTFGPAPTFTPIPAATPSNMYSVSQSPGNVFYNYTDIQNDYVYKVSTESLHSETIWGFAYQSYTINNQGYSASSPAINIFNIPAPALWSADPATHTHTNNQMIKGSFSQIYLNENLRFWHDHIIANVGLTKTLYQQTVQDVLRALTYSTAPAPLAKNYSINFQPVSDRLSIYYGHSEAGIQINNPPSATVPNPPDMQYGKQDEEGIRFRFLEGNRATFSVVHYELSQSNNAIVNPALFSVPPPTIVPPPLLLDRIAKGWEYELNMPISNEVSLMANYTNFTNRVPNLQTPFRGTSEKSGAVWVYYSAGPQSSVKGLSFGGGLAYQSARPGDTASGVTAASTDTNQIPNQPTFTLPASTIVNLSAAYTFNMHWTARVFVDNVLNEKYFSESLNRNAVYPGVPTNWRGSVTYSF